MRRTWSLWFLLLTCLIPLSAQEDDYFPEDAPPIIWDSYVPEFYRAGDGIFSLNAGIVFPTVFAGKGIEGTKSNIKLGGMGKLAFSYFLTPNLYFGGELGGMFAPTGGRNMIYIVPFGLHLGYQFVFGRFEIPVQIMSGSAPQLYLEKRYWGWIIKPGISGFYRFNSDWSFGINAHWWMLP